MLSACVTHRLTKIDEQPALVRCVESLMGYDELILVANTLGIPKAFNTCLGAASGDYIALIADDCYMTSDALEDLPDERGVTVPLVNGVPTWNPVYCFPRWVYDRIGGFDEGFTPAYFEDDDMIQRLADAGIPVIVKRAVTFEHPKPGSTITRLYAANPASVHESPQYKRSHSWFVRKWGHEPYSYPILEEDEL